MRQVAKRFGGTLPEDAPWPNVTCTRVASRRFSCGYAWLPGNTFYWGRGRITLREVPGKRLRGRYDLHVKARRLAQVTRLRYRGVITFRYYTRLP